MPQGSCPLANMADYPLRETTGPQWADEVALVFCFRDDISTRAKYTELVYAMEYAMDLANLNI